MTKVRYLSLILLSTVSILVALVLNPANAQNTNGSDLIANSSNLRNLDNSSESILISSGNLLAAGNNLSVQSTNLGCSDATIIITKQLVNPGADTTGRLNDYKFPILIRDITDSNIAAQSIDLNAGQSVTACLTSGHEYNILEAESLLRAETGLAFDVNYSNDCRVTASAGQSPNCTIRNTITAGSSSSGLLIPQGGNTGLVTPSVQTPVIITPQLPELQTPDLITPQAGNTGNGIIEPIPAMAKLTVVTQIENKCSVTNESGCLPIQEHDEKFGHIVRALLPSNTITTIVGPNEGRSLGWIYPLFIHDSEIGLQYYVWPTRDLGREFNVTMSPGCEGIIMSGENKTCNILYKSPTIS